MKRQMIRAWVANALCLAALLWLYAGDLRNALAARSAEVSAFQELPSVLQPALVLAATALALGFALYGLARRRGPDFRGYRLLPIVLVSALFVDLLFSESEVPVSSAGAATFALQHFAAGAQELASGGRLPTRPEKLQPLLEQLGRPPYLVRGAPASAYGLQVREGCEGPVTEAPGAEVGTLLYCVGPRAQVAWVTLVALPTERTFGAPQVLSAGGRPRFVTVMPMPEGEAGEGSAAPGASGAFRDAPEPAPAPPDGGTPAPARAGPG